MPQFNRRAAAFGGGRRGLRKQGGQGGSTPWTPAADANLVAWFDGVNVVYGATVTASDLANSNDVVQSTAAQQPSAGTINGVAAMSFDGLDHLRTGGALSPVVTSPYAVFSVVDTSDANGDVSDGTTSGGRMEIYTQASTLRIYSGSVLAAGSGLSGVHGLCCVFGSSGAIYRDDFTTAIATGSSGTQVPAGITLGTNFSSATGTLTGSEGEWVLRSGSPDQATRNLYRDYLNSRWSLSIT